jgi:hypothetical protein
MIVWLWAACGPARRGLGVTDDETRARQAVEAILNSGDASSARVEMAAAHLGIRTLTSGYEPTGHGWTARRRDGRITWAPITAELAS